MTKVIELNKTVIDSLDLSTSHKYIKWNKILNILILESGKEHYKLIQLYQVV
jgi:hypothetical protein